MSTIENIFFFTFLGSVAALVGGVVLLAKEKLALRVSHFLASFAAGVLLGAAFFDLLPEAIHEGEGLGINIFSWALAGIIIFFILERIIHWFHHHEEHHQNHKEVKTTVPLIIIGDTMHNFIDGVVIAATFMVSAPVGIVTAFSVFAHEIPQEIGDFGLMLHKGLRRKRILLVNLISAAAAFGGALITYSLGNVIEPHLPRLLALTAGFFIYIAASDLIPEIHHEKRRKHAIFETVLLLSGVLLIYLTSTFLGHE